MSPELIGIITTAIALGTVLFAAIRGVRQDLRGVEDSLRADIRSLHDEMRTGDNSLRDEIGSLRRDVGAGDDALRQAGHDALRQAIQARCAGQAMQAGHALREEMQAGSKDIGEKVGAVGDRLSKVEGVIEGLFWSSRNQPPDKPREGVA